MTDLAEHPTLDQADGGATTRRDILTAVPTAFDADGALDLDGSRKILRYVGESGNEGAFVLGTTGEFPAMTRDERKAVADLALEELGDRMRVVVHAGGVSTSEALEYVRHARDSGARELAALTPYYLPTTDAGLLDYFSRISDEAGDLDVYLYIYKFRSGNFVNPELIAKLAELPNVVGAKVSEEPFETLDAYRAVVPAEFRLYTGADRDLAFAADHGAQGVVSGVSSVLPKPFRELAAAADSGDADRLTAAQAAVDDVVSVIGGNMARMKAAYRTLDVVDTHVRMAIDAPDAAALAEIDRVIAQYR
ncbi:dihydrodipicolinate synthase family protein [Herbiconiux sp. L3-i23]|uniref:dihydrodipicolinate synthase family protein n=1 Tax=Herbiconiux sp. L3-i23 TaxID=2905871 RepID=UPI00205B809B|nr:dihydrodipicolinate synthase family protein [Herbiconiux sp. L3-i23]BDI23633.1 4-hydroxy-tetrahydrodipicolinate synthase [Herbiconiux sp. L3-i23]